MTIQECGFATDRVASKLLRSATMPVGISCPVSGHLTMTAPIELSLFRIVLFRRHTPQLCEHHLTRGRPDRRKLSNSPKTTASTHYVIFVNQNCSDPLRRGAANRRQTLFACSRTLTRVTGFV